MAHYWVDTWTFKKNKKKFKKTTKWHVAVTVHGR